MFGLRRRFLGVTLLLLAAVLFAQPIALWRAVDGADVLPSATDPTTLIALAPPAVIAAGAVFLVAGAAAIRNRQLPARSSLAVPAVGVVVGIGLLTAAGYDPAALAAELPESGAFLLAGTVTGAAVAPVIRGTVDEDTPVLLAGATLLLASTSLSPLPAFTLSSGLAGGVAAVALLWGIDAESWRP